MLLIFLSVICEIQSVAETEIKCISGEKFDFTNNSGLKVFLPGKGYAVSTDI